MKIALGTLHKGAAGTALEMLCRLEPGDPPDWAATIGGYFIEAPGQSPAWRHYVLAVVHLRPIEGVKSATLRFPGATHEFLMYALNPEKNPTPLDVNTHVYLRPINLCEQVHLPHDAAAASILTNAAREVAHGKLWAEPPLSGMVEPWRFYLHAQAIEFLGEDTN